MTETPWTSVAKPSTDTLWAILAAMPEAELRARVERAVAESKATLARYQHVFDATVSPDAWSRVICSECRPTPRG